MVLPDRSDSLHKAWIYRLLTAICDDPVLTSVLFFKGGTCAAMRGLLDRFSIDLDFDYIGSMNDMYTTNTHLEKIFTNLGLSIKNQSSRVPQYILKYPNNRFNERNTLIIDVVTPPPPLANKYENVRFDEIDRILTCQTIPTMFANKLVALIDRYEKSGGIAGRDLYDIHHFFLQGYRYEDDVIKERRQVETIKQYFKDLIDFIHTQITQTIIDQDLNVLLPPVVFKKIRKTLKPETIVFLRDELIRL
ncbi:MAG: nucleotidyl transferase AbiEii/AbiGii toxin family protein [Bacteroidetes bacterium]|nr:nucleotidyl transferase AbiEii/AbiGii toxin family protein [Bacteroidota bacterium]